MKYNNIKLEHTGEFRRPEIGEYIMHDDGRISRLTNPTYTFSDTGKGGSWGDRFIILRPAPVTYTIKGVTEEEMERIRLMDVSLADVPAKAEVE